MQFALKHLTFICFCYSLTGIAYSESSDPRVCFENKDKACLEALAEEPSSSATSIHHDAVHFLGLLYVEDKQYEKAIKQFKLGALYYGDKPRNIEKLKELFNSGNGNFKLDDCRSIEIEKCYLDLAQRNPRQAGGGVAYYSIAARIVDTDPDRSVEYLTKAAEAGHSASKCLLANAYSENQKSRAVVSFVPEVARDPEKAEYWDLECPFNDLPLPFDGFKKKHFAKYKAANNHKAYIKSGSYYQSFQSGAATAEIAASLAGEICKLKNKNKRKRKSASLSVLTMSGSTRFL